MICQIQFLWEKKWICSSACIYLLLQYAGACVHVSVFVFVRLWILLQQDTIFPAVITIDLAIDGDVSSVMLSVPGHGPLFPWGYRHDSPQFLWQVSSFTSGVASGPLGCLLSPASSECCMNLAPLSAAYLCRGYSGSMCSMVKLISINRMAQ